MSSGRARIAEGVVSMCLRRATSRAKSDVANKLVSMLLHELSAKVLGGGPSVSDPAYAERVTRQFGEVCPFCDRPLKGLRVAVEHLDGMNRFRLGLHIPGNVLVACHACNSEKRRDDQMERLRLAETGWASFLSHDGKRCGAACKSCLYWRARWPDDDERVSRMASARKAIEAFRAMEEHAAQLERSERIRKTSLADAQKLYRDGQSFATERIEECAEKIVGMSARSA